MRTSADSSITWTEIGLSGFWNSIGDKRVIRLITKWLNAGVMEGTDWTDTGRGSPQGATVSPVLANVYLHYVLDLWVHKSWRKRKVEGDMIIVRYADDCVPRRHEEAAMT